MKAIKEDNADLVVVDGGAVQGAIRDFNAKPIIAESYGPGSTKLGERPAVAVIKKSSPVKDFGNYFDDYLQSVSGSDEYFLKIVFVFSRVEGQEILSQWVQG